MPLLPEGETRPSTIARTPLAKRREESLAREAVKRKCWGVLSSKWSSIREACNEHWNGPDAIDSQFERSVFREHIEVFEHGVVMSLVIFGALRITAHPKFHPAVDKYVMPIIRLTPPPKKQKKPTAAAINQQEIKSVHVSNGRQFKSFLEQKRDTHVDRIHKAAEAPHDFMVATLVGVSATCFFMRPKQMRLDFEEAPLSPGRSLLSEHLCDDFIQIYQQTDPQVFAFNHSGDGDGDGDDTTVGDANLKTFEQFALHCILRKAHIEERIHAGESKPMVLPTNGPWN